jgi:hypothetical protein
LVDEGMPIRRIVLGYYAISLSFGLIALFAPGLLKLVLLVLLGGLILALLIALSYRVEGREF